MIDHLVLGTPDLEHGRAWVEQQLGISPASGGQHPRWGTHNALARLGASSYLEVLGPRDRRRHNARQLSSLEAPELVWWCVPMTEEALRVPHDVIEGARSTPDGQVLKWSIYQLRNRHPLLPFLIDWGSSPHPAATAPAGLELAAFALSTPEPGEIIDLLGKIGHHTTVIQRAEQIGYRALVRGPLGTAQLVGTPHGLRWV